MKKLLFMLLLPFLSWGQAQKMATTHRQVPSLLGIGPFLINETTEADLSKICLRAGISLQESYSLHPEREAGDSIIAFRIPYESEDTYSDASYLASPSKHAIVYYLPEFTVGDIKINELSLTIYNGKLVKIYTSRLDDLPELFKAKYGVPVVSSLKSATKCVYKLSGRTVAYNDESFFE
ncbi:hypothetical protein HHL22_20480 [Hymenobacter sp. RP-2-7]|uniref:Uncharacterized protein n=1 Tax=Hymenobacter polaris TaxID=2682546 RepID=A0A7Y0AHX2_9BACT|nr:hypothetical protein [Hymenobacter polaris]NML67584.1 hypothetical protein [Hymenobacter polaris]